MYIKKFCYEGVSELWNHDIFMGRAMRGIGEGGWAFSSWILSLVIVFFFLRKLSLTFLPSSVSFMLDCSLPRTNRCNTMSTVLWFFYIQAKFFVRTFNKPKNMVQSRMQMPLLYVHLEYDAYIHWCLSDDLTQDRSLISYEAFVFCAVWRFNQSNISYVL